MLQSMGLQRVTYLTEQLNNKSKRETIILCIYVEDFVKSVLLKHMYWCLSQLLNKPTV